MSWQSWLAIAATCGVLATLATNRVAPERAFLVALAALVLTGVVEPARALSGFSSVGMLTVGVLFVIAGAVQRTRAVSSLVYWVLGAPKSAAAGVLRLAIPVSAASAFINNTPLVALLLPEVRAWARRLRIPPSRVLIPLSYAAILGGCCTLIGTSTNLVVTGLLSDAGVELGFFDIGRIGLPVAITGLLYLVLAARFLLPNRPDPESAFADLRSFTAELLVQPGGPLAGRRLGDVSGPGLAGLHPVEIQRGGTLIAAPGDDEILEGGDRLVVTAPAAALIAVDRFPGLAPAHDPRFELEGGSRRRVLVELIISSSSPLVGEQVGRGAFRRRYGGAVVAIARHGERIPSGSFREWTLAVGDTLLVAAGPDFIDRHRGSGDFYLLSRRAELSSGARWHAPFTLGVTGAMIAAAATGLTGMFEASVGAATLLLATGVIDWREAESDINWRLLLVIAAAIGLGAALADSGAASSIAGSLTDLGGGDPRLTLALVYVATALTTELVTNNAAAVLLFPVAMSAAADVGASPVPFVAAVMIAASASFATPVGYQTNLMVYGPGGYRFGDFFRAGLPLSLLVGAVTVYMAPIAFGW